MPRILVQMTILLVTVGLAFASVVQGSTDLAGLALAGVAIAVLLGVAVDVFDAARQERRNPLDAMRRAPATCRRPEGARGARYDRRHLARPPI